MQYKVCLSKTVALQDISYEHLHKEIDLKSLSVRLTLVLIPKMGL